MLTMKHKVVPIELDRIENWDAKYHIPTLQECPLNFVPIGISHEPNVNTGDSDNIVFTKYMTFYSRECDEYTFALYTHLISIDSNLSVIPTKALLKLIIDKNMGDVSKNTHLTMNALRKAELILFKRVIKTPKVINLA